MKHPFYSIIIPTYNSANTLAACLDSILGQTITNFEILIIDGESIDGTIKIIEKYFALKTSCIRLYSEKDKGIYDAMNKGIKLSKGEWIYFLGSDDKFISYDVLKNINEHLAESNSLDVIYGNVFSTRFNGIYDGEFSNDKIFNKNICHQAIFFNKQVFKKIGFYNLKYKVHADWDHNLRWFQSKKIEKKYVNVVCAEYADGGYSSINNTDLFFEEIRWKYFLHDRSKLSVGYKYLILKLEFIKSIKCLDFVKLFYVVCLTPIFLLNNSFFNKNSVLRKLKF